MKVRVKRYPRLAPKRYPREVDVDALVTETRELFKVLRRQKSLYREQKIKIGHSLLAIRRMIKHGEWEDFYERTFADSGVSLRRAQEYMELAREANGKNAGPRFSLGRDAEMQKAVEQHKRDIAVARRKTPLVLRPCLHFGSQAEQREMQQLWESDRDLLHGKTVELWRQVLGESQRRAA